MSAQVGDFVGGEDGFTGTLVRGGASAIANAATRTALDNRTQFGDNLRASIPDVIGQALWAGVTYQKPNVQVDANPVDISVTHTADNVSGVYVENKTGFDLEVASQQKMNEINKRNFDQTVADASLSDVVVATAQRTKGRRTAFYSHVSAYQTHRRAEGQKTSAYIARRQNLGQHIQNPLVLPHSTGRWDFSNGISMKPFTDAEIRARGGITQGEALGLLGNLAKRNSAELGKAAVNETLQTAEFFADGTVNQVLGPRYGGAAAASIDTSGIQFQNVDPHATYAVQGGTLVFGGGPVGVVKSVAAAGRVDNVAKIRQTGSGTYTAAQNELDDIAAEIAYKEIRASNSDVVEIANANNLKVSNVQKLKDHVFYDQHLLYEDYGSPELKRFDANLNAANAWSRLRAGNPSAADKQWMRHEIAERWYMNRNGPSYLRGHAAAQKRFPAPEGY